MTIQAYAIEPAIEAMLDNWGRWASQREGGAARGVNQQFRLALRGHRWSAPASGGVRTLKVDEAWRVEQTICNPMFSPRYRTLLTEHYAHGRRPLATCALLHMPHLAYEAELWKAAYLFKDAFSKKFPDYCLT